MRARTISRWHGDQDGVVAIEFALVAPLLLMLLFGMVQFGRAYNAKVELTAAVREGARVLALGSGDVTDTTKDAAPGLDEASITVETSTDGTTWTDPPSPATCVAGTKAWVQATYPFDLDIPFWRDDTITISAKGAMRCGG
jgi:Flp pilus assembly protein TadG